MKVLFLCCMSFNFTNLGLLSYLQLYISLIYPDRETGNILIGRWGQRCAGAYAKAGAMAGTDDLVTINQFFRWQVRAEQGRAIVSAAVLYGIVVAVKVEDGHVHTIHQDQPGLTLPEF